MNEQDDLPPLIYHKVKSNYLVYITQIPKIVLMNEMGFMIAQLYVSGKTIESIVHLLSEKYPDIAETELLNAVSYTHLDVYKRQMLLFIWGVFCFRFLEFLFGI